MAPEGHSLSEPYLQPGAHLPDGNAGAPIVLKPYDNSLTDGDW